MKEVSIIVFLVISLLSCESSVSITAKVPDENEVKQLKQIIDSCLETNNYDDYINNQVKLAQIYKESDSLAAWLYCYDRIIKISRDNISLDTAISFYKIVNDQIWKTPEDTQSLNNLAWIHRQIAYEFGPKLQQWQLCIQYYQQGIALIEKSDTWTSDKAIKFLKPCGSAFTRLGEPQKAVGYLKECYTICEKFSDTLNMLKSLNDLGIAYYDISKFAEALSVYHRALALNLKPNYPEERFGTYSKLTTYYLDQKNTDSVKFYIDIMQESISNKTPEIDDKADYYTQMARFQLMLQNYQNAEEYYYKGIQTFLTSGESRKREAAKVYIELGSMNLKLNNYNNAIQNYHEALKLIIANFNETDVSRPLIDKDIFPENTILAGCEGKGDAFYALYLENKSTAYLYNAIAQYESAIRITKSLKNSYELESSKIKLEEKTLAIANKLSLAKSTLKDLTH